MTYNKLKFIYDNMYELKQQMLTIDNNNYSNEMNILNYCSKFLNSHMIHSTIPRDKWVLFKCCNFARKKLRNINYNNYIKLDINSSHPYALYEPYKFRYSIYTPTDHVDKFHGIIKEGRYYIETNNYFPFHGNGWYSDDLIQFGIDKKIISINDILYEYISSGTYPKDYFKVMIDKIISIYKDPQIYKRILRIFCGYLGKTQQQLKNVIYTNNDDELLYYSELPNILVHKKEKNEPLHEIISIKTYYKSENYLPIYTKMKDNEKINLYKLYEKYGGEIAYLNYDSITLNNPKIKYNKNDHLTYQIGDHKEEVLKDYQRSDEIFKFINTYNYIYEEKKWNTFFDNGDENDGHNYNDTKKRLKNGLSMLVLGNAGNGKTKVCNDSLNELNNKKILKMSFTHGACSIIKGNTLHSTFKVNLNDPEFSGIMTKKVKKSYILWIDEIFLCPKIFMKFIYYVKQNNKQIIFSGDPSQLPPIDKIYSRLTIDDLIELVDNNKTILTYNHRYSKNDELKIQKMINEKNFNLLKNGNPLYGVCFFNKMRKEINERSTILYIKENPNKKMLKINKSNKKFSQDIVICEGMPVICYETQENKKDKKEWFNGEFNHIKKIKGNKIILDNNKIINKKIFENYYVVGFGLSLYKIQGQTFDFPYKLYDIPQLKKIEGGIYTALTRNKHLENIYI